MTRLTTRMVLDCRLQFRNGFYTVSLIVAGLAAILLNFLNDEALAWVLPLVLFENTIINTFFFVAGLILLEKAEGSLSAEAVTPLRGTEYLASKVMTLTLLTIVEGVALTLLTYGMPPNLPLLVLGLAGAALLFTLAGLAVMTRYASINEFLMPSVAYTLLLCIPMLEYFGMLEGAVFLLHPLQPSMEALAHAFTGADGPMLTYVLVAPLPWIALAGFMALRLFRGGLVTAS